MVTPTKHAIGLRSASGVELLAHIGLDTVTFDGTPFSLKVKEGDTVKKGEVLVEFDKASFTGVSPPLENMPMPITVDAPSPAPAKDHSTSPIAESPGKKANAIETANAEPDVTPIIEGSAKGFLVIPCMIAPDTANNAPTSAAAAVLGSRRSCIIW